MSTSFLAVPPSQQIGMPCPMGGPSDSVVGDNVKRARERKGWSIARLARETGVALNTIQSIEEGRTRKSKYLPDIARVLGITLGDIDPSQIALVAPTSILPASQVIGPRDLPVYGTTDAGEGVMVLSSEPVDREDRPPSLANVRSAYGVIVQGDSMSPVVRSGDTVVVHPHRPPRTGDVCLFRAEDHGEFRSLLKEFVGHGAECWRVKRYQPEEKTFAIKRKDWPECHVVVTIHRR